MKFIMSILKHQISFSSNFASLFSVMRQLLCTFLAEVLYTFNKRSLSKYTFGEISCEQSKVWDFAQELSLKTLKSDTKFKEKLTFGFKYKFGDFSPNHSKVSKFHFDGLFLFKVYKVWAKETQRCYLSWHWTVMRNLNKPWPFGFKNGMRNLVSFHKSTQNSKKTILWWAFFVQSI